MNDGGYLIAEDLNLTVAAMGRRRVSVRVGWRFLVRVDLNMQRQTFHALLTREIGAETLHRHVYLRRNRTGTCGDVRELLYQTYPLNGTTRSSARACALAIRFARDRAVIDGIYSEVGWRIAEEVT